MPRRPDGPGQTGAVSLRSLLPPGSPITVERLIEELDLAERAVEAERERPYVALNMISTADGRATLSGRSGTIGGEADRLLFHGLRTVVDAVMAGAGTVRTEGYHRLVRDPVARATRRERGLAEEPLACVVSGRLALGEQIPLLAADRRSIPGSEHTAGSPPIGDRRDLRSASGQTPVAILTASQASLSGAYRSDIEYIRCVRGGELDLAAALRELHARFGVRTLLCEGGPHLNAHLLAAGLVDELFLSLAPTLTGGEASESLRIVSGVDLEPPVAMELVSAHEHQSHLFLRYRVVGASSSGGPTSPADPSLPADPASPPDPS